MLLSECASFVPIRVIRDQRFRTPGLLADPQQGMLTFIESDRFLPQLRHLGDIHAVITTEALAPAIGNVPGLAVAAAPRRAFFELHNYLARETSFYGSSAPTVVDPSAQVHPAAWVAPMNVRIGPGCVVEPHATILERSTLERNVVVHAGAVIGAIGLQVARENADVLDLEHAGSVVLGEGVRVLSQAVVARAIFQQATTVGARARIGNHAFISHNVQVGAGSIIGHGAVINGNVTMGAGCWIGPNATISHCLRLGERANISLGSVVVRDVGQSEHVSGHFAVDHRRFLRRAAIGRTT